MQKGIKLGLVTASWEPTLYPLRNYSLIHYFKVIITGEDGFPSKPAPDGTLECLRRMKIRPSQAITIGDSPLDIRAGNKAGALTIGVLCGIGSRSQLEAEAPTAIVEEVTQVLSILK